MLQAVQKNFLRKLQIQSKASKELRMAKAQEMLFADYLTKIKKNHKKT